MALDLGCDLRQPYYGDGSQVIFSYYFEILKTEDLRVAFWDSLKKEYFDIPPDHDAYGWAKLDSLPKIEFNSPIAYGQFFIIYRLTEVAPPKAFFVKGHPVKADDLNDNFDQLQFAITDNRCSIERIEDLIDVDDLNNPCSGVFRESFKVSNNADKFLLPDGYSPAYTGTEFVYLNGTLLRGADYSPPSPPPNSESNTNSESNIDDDYSITLENGSYYLCFDHPPLNDDIINFVYTAPVDCDSTDLAPLLYRQKYEVTTPASQYILPYSFDKSTMHEYVYLNGVLLSHDDYRIDGSYFKFFEELTDGSIAEYFTSNGDFIDFVYSTGIQILNHGTENGLSNADRIKLDGIETGAQVNTVTSVNGSTGDVIVSSGGSNFSGNYNDLSNKPTLGSAAATDSTDYATAAQGALADTALQSHQDISNKADLVGGKLNTSQIPDLAVTEYLGAVANETAMLALTGEKGDWCNRSDTGQMFIISGTDPTQLASWAAISYPASPVVSVAGKTGIVTIDDIDDELATNGTKYRKIPKNSKTSAYTITASDRGKVICITTGGVTVTTGVFTAGDAVSIYNDSGSDQTITEGSTSTLRLVGSSTTGDRTLAGYGLCTLLCVDSADTFVIAGTGVS